MATVEYVPETLIDAERHLKLLTGATRVDEVIGAASSYLAGWSKDRIKNLQKIDGGWGPFDYQERPEPILRVGDFARISDQLSRHCLALKEGGIEPTPDLLELGLFFALAKQAAETFLPVTPRPYTSTSPSPCLYRHWSDKNASASG
jgi:hypothetical protein